MRRLGGLNGERLASEDLGRGFRAEGEFTMMPTAWFGHLDRWQRKCSRRAGPWRKIECCCGFSLGGSILSNLQSFLFLFFKRCISVF